MYKLNLSPKERNIIAKALVDNAKFGVRFEKHRDIVYGIAEDILGSEEACFSLRKYEVMFISNALLMYRCSYKCDEREQCLLINNKIIEACRRGI